MQKGFIFYHDRCVNCGACSAACILENGWNTPLRNIYVYNSEAYVSRPVINLSLACNHCIMAPCLDACPATAYYRDSVTNAVVIDQKKCIACKYCQWNCPYDAPKFVENSRIIEKCNLCFNLVVAGEPPACTSACPTGALNYGDISDGQRINDLKWFPDKKLQPSVFINTEQGIEGPVIIPDSNFGKDLPSGDISDRKKSDDWSLIGFSFLVTLLVSNITVSLITGYFPILSHTLGIITLAGLISLVHLGQPQRAWRSLANPLKSPLSREIILFVTFSITAVSASVTHSPEILMASFITGLFLLIAIDSVYIYADRRLPVILNSGQTFMSGLLITSFLTGYILPFAFIGIIKLISSLYAMYTHRYPYKNFAIRFLRIAILIITGASLVGNISHYDKVITAIFLSGELLDRIIFYIDFSPINIRSEIFNNINNNNDEKKRG